MGDWGVFCIVKSIQSLCEPLPVCVITAVEHVIAQNLGTWHKVLGGGQIWTEMPFLLDTSGTRSILNGNICVKMGYYRHISIFQTDTEISFLVVTSV